MKEMKEKSLLLFLFLFLFSFSFSVSCVNRQINLQPTEITLIKLLDTITDTITTIQNVAIEAENKNLLSEDLTRKILLKTIEVSKSEKLALNSLRQLSDLKFNDQNKIKETIQFVVVVANNLVNVIEMTKLIKDNNTKQIINTSLMTAKIISDSILATLQEKVNNNSTNK